MDTRLLARIGAGAFVALALTMTALRFRDAPQARSAAPGTVWVPDGDPLAAQLRACAAMGEQALGAADCRAAWAEKRRRFLGGGSSVSPPAGRREEPGPVSPPSFAGQGR